LTPQSGGDHDDAFAYAQAQVGKNGKPLSRELLLRIYWDDESEPSVDCPFVDFFCNPDDTNKIVNTAFVNVNRGYNAYFPMPFRKSARVELVYDGPLPPGPELVSMMPCYSYVCHRTLEHFPKDTGYFHASWRQQSLVLGLKDYVALEATGKGKFIGWNITVRSLEINDCPVDENEKFYIDGETNPSGSLALLCSKMRRRIIAAKSPVSVTATVVPLRFRRRAT
jgi:hypothetical protein